MREPFTKLQYVGHGKADGRCRLCGTQGRLSWDHVPPQGAIEIEPVDIDRLAGAFVGSLGATKPTLSQNGLKFRTLCGRCNSELGTHCDPALQDFALSVGRCLTTTLVLPNSLHFRLRPTAIVRALLGHLAAANTSEDQGGFDAIAHELLYDLDAAVDPRISVSCWVHPFQHTVALREVVMPIRRGRFNDFSRFAILKFFPLGFLVSDSPIPYEDTVSLTQWRSLSAAETAEVPVHLKRVHGPFWPEAPAPDNFVFMGHQGMESVVAKPRKRRLP